jgi:Cu2+-exporting ATPase
VESTVRAGTLNLTGPLTLVATAKAGNSFLAEMIRMMEAAEQGRSGYRRIADRAAALYAPVVHVAAFLTFIGWMVATGDLHNAITIAIAVLIITCPCALGLAVPIVQVMAAQRLFKNGIMVKDGSSIERLAEIDAVIFDKTGTLTSAAPRLVSAEHIDSASLSLAAALALHSRHPYSQALVEAAAGLTPSPVVFDDITEQAGFGLQAQSGATVYRLGKPSWALASPESIVGAASVALTQNGQWMTGFCFEDKLRTDAAVAVVKLKQSGLRVELVSGDRKEPVGLVAAALGVPYRSGVTPNEKVARIKALSAAGQKVFMVGDGLNDTPALGAAHASMAPASASDVGRCAADFVFLRQSLLAIPLAVSVAREARRLIRQNLALAVAYNVVAVPIAIMGLVTPLIAAVAMSGSSILVVANALRLKGGEGIAASAAPGTISAAAILEAAE